MKTSALRGRAGAFGGSKLHCHIIGATRSVASLRMLLGEVGGPFQCVGRPSQDQREALGALPRVLDCQLSSVGCAVASVRVHRSVESIMPELIASA